MNLFVFLDKTTTGILNNYLIYLAFGQQDYRNEALYSLLSFYKFHSAADPIKVLVYTDDVAFFRQILPSEVTYHFIDFPLIESWKGPQQYIYRLKIKVLQQVAANYEGNFLFADTDTVFLQNTMPLYRQIANGTLLLDACEGKLIDNKGGIAAKTRKFLNSQQYFSVPSDKNPIVIDENFTAWNSGTIGFSNHLADCLISIEELIDELHAKSRGKVFVVEQIAVSYYFQQNGTPRATEDFIHHYWDFKEFRPVLADFLSRNRGKSLEEMMPEIEKIDPQALATEKRKYKKLSFLQKQWRKISTGKKWEMPDYKH